ncbi:MAG: CRISPR system precrRNA processing endoribonuclease RAMP protein Cas6 [Bryobacteraceae bacterium]
MLFRFYALRFTFTAREPIHFPPGKSSNILRGAFGVIFRRIACVPQCTGARDCEWRASCPYARMFEPSAVVAGPSGLADWPRPFVFRATGLDGRTVAVGESFHFDLNLFDIHSPAIAYLVLAFGQFGREGLGIRRSRVELTGVSQLDAQGEHAATIFDGSSLVMQQNAPLLELNLAASVEAVGRLRVHFLTPTELKTGQHLARRPEFPILIARIRDRVSTLRELYGDGPLTIDFRAFGERAALVRMTRCDIQQVEILRRSGRTGQVHPIGGFTGKAEYEGDLTEFVPYLSAAKWTGVGRQTVWGKGEISFESL